MSIVSFEFLGFLAALAVVYYVLPMRVRKWRCWRQCGVLAALRLAGRCIPHAETLLIWGCARLIGGFRSVGRCRALLVAEWSRFSAQWC